MISQLDAQPAVLGCMLIEPKTVGPILSETRAEDFTTPGYRMIYEAIRAQFGSGEPCDLITINDRLGGRDPKLLMELMEITPTAVHWQAYVKVLRESARVTRIKELAQLILDEPEEAQIREHISAINALSVERPGLRIVGMADAYRDFFERHAPQEKQTYLDWTFPELTESIYSSPGDMIVLGGYPSDGKTSLALTFAMRQGRDHRVGFYSYETDADKLYDRIVAHEAQIYLPKLKKNSLTDTDWETMAALSDRLTAPQVDLIEASGMTVQDIRAHALARRYDIVYIDYLQKIRPAARVRNASDYETVSQISGDLQQLGRQTGVTVVALSQLSRPEKTKGKATPPPTLSSLRSSGQIEQDADAVMLLYREEPDNSNSRRVLNVAKNKEGESHIGLLLAFDGKTQTFRKSATQQSAPTTRRDRPRDPQIAMEENFVDPFPN